MTRMFVGALAAVAIFATSAAPAFAQGGGASSTGTIQGRVADASGAVLPGVTVTAASSSMIGLQTQVTNENGSFRFPAVPPGVYSVSFELPGFTSVKREGIEVSLGFTANLNVEMTVATLQETVTVTGEAPLIETTDATVGANIDPRQMEELPINGRNWMDLALLTPGARRNESGGYVQNRQGYSQNQR